MTSQYGLSKNFSFFNVGHKLQGLNYKIDQNINHNYGLVSYNNRNRDLINSLEGNKTRYNLCDTMQALSLTIFLASTEVAAILR